MSYNINSLPLDKDTLSEVLRFLSEKDIVSCLRISKSMKAIIERILDTHWYILKTHRKKVEGILNFPLLVRKVEANYSEKKPFPSFRKLFQEFTGHGAFFDQLPLTILDFQHAEKQLRWINEARIATWPEIATQCGIDSSSSSLKEINDEFNREENIAKFKKIECLDLSGLGLQILPPELEKFTNLKILNLSNNWLTDLSPGITKLTDLIQLDLSNNELFFLPSNICNLKQLKRLYLGKNKLRVLPEALGKLKCLEDLFLNDNRLCVLPYSIGQLKHLVTLDLSQNELQFFPNEFWNLEKLTCLDLFHNQVNFLPDEISKLANLSELILSNNQLSSIPETFGNLKKLTILLLNNNRLKTLPHSIEELEHLTMLNLSTNEIQSLPSEFWNLKQLDSLNLFNNQLNSLDAIDNLCELKELILADNKLNFIPETFGNLTQLEILNIENNPWVSIPKPILDSPIAALSSNETLAIYRRQLTHPFFSPLAKLMQAIMQGRNENEIENLFQTLSQNDQNLILEQADGYRDHNNHGEQHEASIDCKRFYSAVGEAIIMKYHQLSQEGKNQLYLHYKNFCLLADMMELLLPS